MYPYKGSLDLVNSKTALGKLGVLLAFIQSVIRSRSEQTEQIGSVHLPEITKPGPTFTRYLVVFFEEKNIPLFLLHLARSRFSLLSAISVYIYIYIYFFKRPLPMLFILKVFFRRPVSLVGQHWSHDYFPGLSLVKCTSGQN